MTGAERESYVVAVAFILAAFLYMRVRRALERRLDGRDAASSTSDEPTAER